MLPSYQMPVPGLWPGILALPSCMQKPRKNQADPASGIFDQKSQPGAEIRGRPRFFAHNISVLTFKY